jgi:DNA repair protein RadA/Sms
VARTRTVHRCTGCQHASPTWVGRCPACEEWGTLVEEVVAPAAAAVVAAPWASVPSAGGGQGPRPIGEVGLDQGAPVATGIGELDRVLDGGLVPGSVTLLGGEPGVGKSSLLLQAAAAVARSGRTVLYATAEESAQQVRSRAERLGSVAPSLLLVAETALPGLLAHIEQVEPALVVVDSIQTLYDPALTSSPGSVTQVRGCTHRLVQEAKARGVSIALVGHVTKGGEIAGPRTLEHLVDTVLSFEGERHHALRLLRAHKHRFGATDELGLFEMTDHGLVGVPDPSGMFLADRAKGVAGSVVVPTIEGHRPLLVELQALVAGGGTGGSPRRSAQGLDAGRLAFLLAVLEKRAGLQVQGLDVYALAAGGVRIVEPGADLALAVAIASSLRDRALPEGLVACGEVGLGGELRQVSRTSRRLAEAARLGFTQVLMPVSAPEPPAGLRALRASHIGEALGMVGLLLASEPRQRRTFPPDDLGGLDLRAS